MQSSLPRAFIWRRLHSLTGLWLVLFLCEHLLVNSQAALWIGDSGRGFVEAVNTIHNLPYLSVIELFLLGVPILVHAVWGIKYAREAKSNDRKTDGSSPSLREYGRNRAYSLQRYTSWFILVFLLFHIAEFRFLDYPKKVLAGSDAVYLTDVSVDMGLYTLSQKLGVTLYDVKKIDNEKKSFASRQAEKALQSAAEEMKKEETMPGKELYNAQTALLLQTAQNFENKAAFIEALESYSLQPTEVIAVCKDFGTASLLIVRDHFKMPLWSILYTLFVLATVFHACNGFWTFLITWGMILKMSAQKAMVRFSYLLMLILGFLGLAAIWGSYWINLKS